MLLPVLTQPIFCPAGSPPSAKTKTDTQARGTCVAFLGLRNAVDSTINPANGGIVIPDELPQIGFLSYALVPSTGCITGW